MRSLPDKLGIRDGQRLWIINAPPVMDLLIRAMTDSVILKNPGEADYIHIFAERQHDLSACLPQLVQSLPRGGMLWVSWPKKAAKTATDLDREIVREMLLQNTPLVDVKVCSVDETWSGLKFVHRKKNKR